MELALREALKGGKAVFPNPMVGAVILDRNGNVVSTGHHACCGAPHAEREALSRAGDVSGFTMVVTLEPCCHHGRTPPCAEAIAEAGIARVVVGMVDPDTQVRGGGIEYLRARGIDVQVGLMEKAAEGINRVYIHHRKTGRSFLHLKMAGTLDGRSAAPDGTSRWITGAESRRRVHEYRRNSHGVLIGGKTAIADDPSLDARDVDCPGDEQPVRIIYTLEPLPGHLKVFNTPGRTIVASPERLEVPRSAENWTGMVTPVELLERTAGEGLGLVLCEGGGTLGASLLKLRLVDRLSIFTAPALLGSTGLPLLGDLGVGSIGGVIRLQDPVVTRTGEDILTEGEVVYRAD